MNMDQVLSTLVPGEPGGVITWGGSVGKQRLRANVQRLWALEARRR